MSNNNFHFKFKKRTPKIYRCVSYVLILSFNRFWWYLLMVGVIDLVCFGRLSVTCTSKLSPTITLTHISCQLTNKLGA